MNNATTRAATVPESIPAAPKLVFVGGGQMASALAGALIQKGWAPASRWMIEPVLAQRERLQESLGVHAISAPMQTLRDANVVVWAVKPQVLHDAVRQTLPHLGQPLHISIAAGIRTHDIARWLQSRRVVRVMPNTAVLVGAGVSGVVALDDVTEDDRKRVAAILAATGTSLWVESDERLDAITALSGSGPAYVFHFLESFQQAAEDLGFDAAQARALVLATMAGAVAQAQAGNAPFATLRQNVTSKRGTTEAALAVLDGANTRGALGQAVQAAYRRAGELSSDFGLALDGRVPAPASI